MYQKEMIHGFLPVRMREFAELEGTLREYVHEKTGAQLCWLDRADENKTFSIAFKTIPEDSTGVFHILEHSVLCGSDKYPVKESFVELLKTSVQTFLNAITFSDKTVYPVSSRNGQDFLNLMDVYLDAVFHPAVFRKPEIFRQEGWRFEGEGDDICLQGVVLNEMKGAFASPDTIQSNLLDEMLYPDTCYRFVSGGDPVQIPTLTYEQFLATHRKYYHPSNARISLVGSVDLEACLEKLDAFLHEFDRRESSFDIPMQKPVPAQRRTVPYAIGPEENPAQRTIVAQATLLSTFDDDLRNNAVSVLSDYLTGDDDAPLKRAILDAGLAQDFSMGLSSGLQQTSACWTALNTDAEQQEALEQTVRETLTRIVDEGLDRDRLDACFCRYAFQLRDRDSGAPRSLAEAIDMLDDWLYGGDPAQGLLAEDALAALEAALATDFPERLLRELFLENEHLVTLTLVPSPTLDAETAAAETARIRAITERWTEADCALQAERAEALRQFQQTPDSEETLATIPMLRLSDLAQAPSPLDMTETRFGTIPLLRHRVGGRLAFLRAYLEANDVTKEELPVFAVMCSLMGCMGTRRYPRSRLPLEILRATGRLGINPSIIEGETPTRCRVLLCASLACLPELDERAASLLAEILTATVWDDVALLRDTLQQLTLGAQMSLASAGQTFAVSRIVADLTAHGVALEATGGIEYASWLKRMSTADDEALRALLAQMEGLARRLTVRERLTLSCNEHVTDAALTRFADAIPAGQAAPEAAIYDLPGAQQEGIVIPAAVGFAAMGTNLLHHGRRYNGSYPVLANVLNFNYLWSEIRVQGGAYGCGFAARGSNDLFYYTYRDPQPARSLDVMRNVPAFLRAFCAEQPDLTGYILGAVSTFDPLRSAELKLSAGEARWLRGITEDEVRTRYQELLHTTADDLLALIPVLEALAAENAVCVAAGKPLLDACGEDLKDLLSL